MLNPHRPRIQEYVTYDHDALLVRFSDVIAELISVQDDYFRMKGDETRAKADAWINSQEETVKGRERDVELATYNVTASIYETRSSIESLTEEKNFILFLFKDRKDSNG